MLLVLLIIIGYNYANACAPLPVFTNGSFFDNVLYISIEFDSTNRTDFSALFFGSNSSLCPPFKIDNNNCLSLSIAVSNLSNCAFVTNHDNTQIIMSNYVMVSFSQSNPPLRGMVVNTTYDLPMLVEIVFQTELSVSTSIIGASNMSIFTPYYSLNTKPTNSPRASMTQSNNKIKNKKSSSCCSPYFAPVLAIGLFFVCIALCKIFCCSGKDYHDAADFRMEMSLEENKRRAKKGKREERINNIKQKFYHVMHCCRSTNQIHVNTNTNTNTITIQQELVTTV